MVTITKYEKINTLYNRDKKGVIITYEYSMPEFLNTQLYHVEEKIDGMNIRVIITKDDIEFRGRTDKAVLPNDLISYLNETFIDNPYTPIYEVFKLKDDDQVVLYGEGCGPKIQKNGDKYSDHQIFIIFDAMINGTWLDRNSVMDIAKKLGIKHAPSIGIMTLDQIVEYVKSRPKSHFGDFVIEGIVARSNPLVLTRLGKRVIFKLKDRDFRRLEKLK